MQADEPDDDFDVDWTPVWPDEDGRLEPIFFEGPQWIEFAEVEPPALSLDLATADGALLVEFEKFALIDPEGGGEEPEEPAPLPRQRASAASLAASFGVHLLTLLVLIGWHAAPAQVAGAIPVQLVLENSAGPPEETKAGQSVAVSADQAPPAKSSAVPPPEPPAPQTRVASVTPPAKPRPPPPRRPSRSVPAPHAAKPAPPPPPPPPPRAEAAASPRVPAAPPRVFAAPAPVPPHATAPAASATSIAVGQAGARSGAATGEGDYFAQLEQLTRPYLYMLSPSFLAGRRGRTTLTIVVRDDGTIDRVGVKRSSGYPDIDARIEQMVQAVGHFPPLPEQLRRPGADLDFNLVFPEVLQQ